MSSIMGIGLDIVATERIRRAIERHGDRLTERLLSPSEQAALAVLHIAGARKVEYLAGRFAAKEAVAKAIGRGIGALGWRNIAILARGGAPACRLDGRAAAEAERRGIAGLYVTITHERGLAAACAVASGVPSQTGPVEVA
jgi:holo-[acyl-carrier protein] synthase